MKPAMIAKSKQKEKKKAKIVLLLCAPKLSIKELASLSDLLDQVQRSGHTVMLPESKDDLFFYLEGLCRSYGINIKTWKPAKRSKPKETHIGLGRQDALLLTEPFDKAVLVGISSRLDKISEVLKSKNRKMFLVVDNEA